jgi:amidase
MTTTLPERDRAAIARLDATAQAELVRSGQVTAEELVSAAITRIETLNPTVNAVITPMYDMALAQVRAGLPDGPFTGVPYLVKDLGVEIAGVRLNEGSRYLTSYVSTVDSEIVVRLRRAGLAIVGKTNTPEFGMVPTVEPVLHGATRNPWDLTRTTGGSSGGAAAAVASGMVPFAHGSDAGGSLRFPASCCGLFGFKPTRGRIPMGPHYGDVFGGWATDHAITRSVRDSAALLDATAGPMLGDPYVAPVADRPFAQEVGRDAGRLRIGFSAQTPGGEPVHDDCVAALHDATALMESLGHHVEERHLPPIGSDVGAAIVTVYRAAVDWIVRYWARELGREPNVSELEPLTRAFWEQGRAIPAGQYLLAVTTLQAFGRRIARFLTDIDVWLTPTLAQPPLPLGHILSTEDDPWRAVVNGGAFVPFPAILANISGAPAMSVPLYWSPANLPIGVHALGRYGQDAALFRLAAQLEQARPWANRTPPLFAQ